MLSYAASQVGSYGWVFGIREAMDQFGTMFGPLAVAGRGDFHATFAVLAIPTLISLLFVGVARLAYLRPQDMEPSKATAALNGYPRIF